MNIILQFVAVGVGSVLVGAVLGAVITMANRDAVSKLINDTLKDDSQAWDFVRISGAMGVFTYLGAWDVAVAHDYMVIVNHATDFGLGLCGTLGAYAGSVVGHSWAKK